MLFLFVLTLRRCVMSSRKLSFAAGSLVAAVFAIGAGVARADTITLDATTDGWIRQSSPDHLMYEGDSVSVWSYQAAPRGEGSRRRGVIEFDLSGLPEITGAYLNLYAVNTGTSEASPNVTAIEEFANSMHLHNALPSMTWNNMGNYTADSTDLVGLGHFNIAADQPMGQYYSSDMATSADLTELNAMRVSTDKKLTLFLITASGATSGVRDWGDAGHGGVAQLVLTSIPEPSTFVLMVCGIMSLLAYGWRKRK
jgi:hypothetical protein